MQATFAGLIETDPGASEAELRDRLARAAEANAWLEMAEELGHLGNWRLTLPDRTLTWSTEIYRIYGVTRDTYVPDTRTVMQFYHPEDRISVRAALLMTIEQGVPYDFVARIVHREGHIRHIVSRGFAHPGADGKPAVVFGVVRDVTQEHLLEQALRDANARLDLIAHEDSLTGLANRRRFDATLHREWRRARRERQPLSLLIIDLDFFKRFNDRYGHLAGDACLRAVASAVAASARRPGDLAARYGGEELALILPNTGPSGAATVAEEARAAIQALAIAHAGNHARGVVTASIGVATVEPPGGPGMIEPADLVAEADGLLYEAKRMGRNRVVSTQSLAQAGNPPAMPNEAARLLAFEEYRRAGALRRNALLDRIARLAATVSGTPIALVSLVGETEQVFAGNFGLDHIGGTPRDISFCAHAICGDEPMVVADATRDPRFQTNSLVTGDPGIRYYAGAPLVSPRTGHKLGALCIIDTEAHAETSRDKRTLLTELACVAAEFLEEAAAHEEGGDLSGAAP